MALTDVARFHKDVKVILNKVEQLVHENKELDSQVESLNIKKKKNATKVCVLLAEAHKLKIESYQVIEVEDSASQVEQDLGTLGPAAAILPEDASWLIRNLSLLMIFLLCFSSL